MAAIVDTLGDEKPAEPVEINVRGVVKLRGGGPNRHLQALRHRKKRRGNHIGRSVLSTHPDAIAEEAEGRQKQIWPGFGARETVVHKRGHFKRYTIQAPAPS